MLNKEISMRLALVCYQPSGGVKTYINNILDIFKDLYNIEIHVLSVSSNWSSSHLTEIKSEKIFYHQFQIKEDIEQYFSPEADCYCVQAERMFLDFLEQIKPDLIDFQHLDGLGVSLIGLAKDKGIATIVTLHDYWLICPRTFLLRTDMTLCTGPNLGANCWQCFGGPSFERNLRKKFLNRYQFIHEILCQKADQIIAVSESIRQRMIYEGIPQHKVTTIYPALKNPTEKVKPSKKRDNIIRFGFLGAISAHKGIHLVIEAFRMLDCKFAELHIYGNVDSLFKNTFDRLTKNISSLYIHGSYVPDDLFMIFSHIDVLVVTSVWPETGPLVVQEALRYGVPILGAAIGGILEYVRPEYGAFFEPGHVEDLQEKMQQIIENPQILEGWRNNIPVLPTQRAFAEKLNDLYLQIAQTRQIKLPIVDPAHIRLLQNNSDFVMIRKSYIANRLLSLKKHFCKNSIHCIGIFGTGEFGRKVAIYLRNQGFYVKAYFDNNSQRWGQIYDNIPVQSPNEIKQKNLECIVVVSDWEQDILQQLSKLGLNIPCIGIYSFEGE